MRHPQRRYDLSAHPAPSARPAGPTLVEDERVPQTATSSSLLPPRRVPPGITATGVGPEGRPERPAPPFPVQLISTHNHELPYITSMASPVVCLIAVLGFILAAGLIALFGAAPE